MTQEVTPSQAARDAAAPLCEQKFGEAVLRGEKNGWPIVQAFARLEEQTRTATEREVVERCAAIAEKWRDENKASAAKARRSISEGSRNMAEMLDGAAIECNAIAAAIRALLEQKS